MQKIKLIADTACDIPDDLLREYHIDMPSVPITIDGKGYYERKSFTIREFYEVLNASGEIPATSRVPAEDYKSCYKTAWEEGYTDIISVTINAGGSGTHQSSVMAVQLFYDEYPEALDQIKIHVVDSRSYAMGYGHPVVRAAQMAREGATVEEILQFLDEFFGRLEIYLGCYTLEYVKKSGRVSSSAAFVGDVLGLRPVISLIDGDTKVVEKVRGDKALVPKIVEIFKRQCDIPDRDVLVVSGEVDQYGDDLVAALKKELGREVPHYKAGASITINAGPRIVAVCFQGKDRR